MTDDEARELMLSKARLMGLQIIKPSYAGHGDQLTIEAPIGKAWKGRGHWLMCGGLLAHRPGFYIELLAIFDQGFDDAPYDPRIAYESSHGPR
jgi:hypothetical protein